MGVLAPWKRPNFLSKSMTTSYQAAKHAIDWYKKKAPFFDTIILLQPTSPFRSLKTFDKIYKNFRNKNLNSIATFSEKNEVFSNKKKLVPNGNIYINKVKNLLRYKTFINKETKIFIIKNKKEKIDIDTKKDWLMAKKLIKNK